ncbi:two-component system sensor histidine kinase NtrB [Sporosarcina luteola]|uniref:two-component system sensor histidine kinase NtrB n=1 Tax=Sporosarcina luteola TaxID=582850 RepID=UPI00203C7FEF|nr:PAS domain S-box protein [Sporosarcina luteola]MCM3710123.1 PAS domain S-box protein [Sporosarcina luteola]
MENGHSLQSKNKCLIISFGLIVLLQLIASPFFDQPLYVLPIAACALFNLSLFGFLHFGNPNQKIISWLIIVGSNFYILSLLFVNADFPYLFFLFFPIIISLIFSDKYLLIAMLVLTAVELIVLLRILGPYFYPVRDAKIIIHFSFLFILVMVLLFFITVKIGPQMKKLLIEKEVMSMTLSSKDGYLDLFFEHAQDAIAVFSLDQKLLAVNPAFEEVYGWKREECIGKSIQLTPPSEFVGKAERQRYLLQGRSFTNIRSKELRKNGTVFEAETTMAPIYDKNKEIVALSLITRDITEKIQAERLKIEAIKLNAIGEIAATVAHEVRNPMTSVNGFVQLMNEDPDNPYRTYTEIMENEIERINLIANEFLILSKPNIKQRKEIDVENAIIGVIDLFAEELKMRQINCSLFLAEYPSTVFGNEESLKQVFINLMKNSLEAVQDGGTISFYNSIVNHTISITLTDNGHGMDQETFKQLFIPFFTTKDGATGLGLVITKKIVLDHGGKIDFNELRKKGTELTVTFPIYSLNKSIGLATLAE